MLVSHVARFIYLKTVKTGGTSVEMYFEPFCTDPKLFTVEENKSSQVSSWGIVGSRGHADDVWFNHMQATDVRERLGREIWESYFKFCVVRNPYDKVVSHFWYDLDRARAQVLADADFTVVRRAFGEWLSLSRFVIDHVIYTIAGKFAMDRVIRHEHLQDGVETVCGLLGLPWQPKRLLRLKSGFRTRNEPYQAYYEPATRDLIRQQYGWELDWFSYGLE